MDDKEPRKKYSRDALKALGETRDEYAAVEVLLNTAVLKLGRIPHMQDATARLLNYDDPDVSAPDLYASEAALAEALRYAMLASSMTKRAHHEALGILPEDLDPGRPRTGALLKTADTIRDRLTEDGKPKKEFGR